ncbi:MAG: hypothetical protein LBQ59_05435 [Candidatus Peribacteria bacterium]|nr:hypothetical protein [Candidatus Peribacteria bacterium]
MYSPSLRGKSYSFSCPFSSLFPFPERDEVLGFPLCSLISPYGRELKEG